MQLVANCKIFIIFEKPPLLKPTLILATLLCLFSTAQSQRGYWQQQVNVTIDVSLDDKEHTLDGFERIEYSNHSPDTLYFIWFHLWPNAYKNDKTAFSDQLLENGHTKFYFSSREDKGYINRLDFRVDNISAVTEDHPQHIDIVKLLLPQPLPPGGKTVISTPFHVKLPYNFSRGGHEGQSYQATQWYPKPAVYDHKGWHPMPYLDQGEFYSEFGNYDVSITVPKNYVVAASGELITKEEKDWLRGRAGFSWQPVKTKEKTAGGQLKTMVQEFPESSAERKTLRYRLNNTHDFAWFADKRFIVQADSLRLPTGKEVEVLVYYTPAFQETWGKGVAYAKEAVRYYSALLGDYPYPVVQVVQGPESFGGGMEYPSITVISPESDAQELDKVIAHEIGHNWFYGALGSNEREHPWLDEGLNSYCEDAYAQSRYGRQASPQRLVLASAIATKTDQPVALPSTEYTEMNYGLSVYYKAAEWMRYLETRLGKEALQKALRDYYRDWQFKHPGPADFRASLEKSTGKNLETEFSYLGKRGDLPGRELKGSKTLPYFNIPALASLLNHPTKNLLLWGPALGINAFDKIMLGAMITNFHLPPPRFQFLLAPMYATGSGKLKGSGLLSYSIYPDKGVFRAIDAGVSGSFFSANRFTDASGNNTYLGFSKIVPGFKLALREPSARSTRERFIQFKSFIISEDRLRFYNDTIITPPRPDTTIQTRYTTISENRVLNQLRFVLQQYRALYPYSVEGKLEQGKHFLRATFTGNYFFNYPRGGGLSARIFGGKFLYTGGKTLTKQFSTDRFHLNMTGPDGYEDYTYSDYFAGRNKFNGILSQQIMIRDGAFKVRTDLLADKVGRSDNWLLAANFSTTIPASLNPLQLLPVKIPLKLFLDIGTYADAWEEKEENDRFLYDAGLQIPLLKETVNIYIPLFYSSVYKDYYESTIAKKERFWKRIAFSIDISNFSFRKIDRNFSF